MRDVEVIEDPAAAVVALDPVRARLLAELVEPASAGALASKVGMARQKLNYHLRALEAHGLVELAEERKRGGITERVLRATAATYVISPAALGETAVDPERAADRLSAGYLVALAGRSLLRRRDHVAAGKPAVEIDAAAAAGAERVVLRRRRLPADRAFPGLAGFRRGGLLRPSAHVGIAQRS